MYLCFSLDSFSCLFPANCVFSSFCWHTIMRHFALVFVMLLCRDHLTIIASGTHAFLLQLFNCSVPPKWKIEPSDQSAVVGERVTFHCSAEGYPPPLIRWKISTGLSIVSHLLEKSLHDSCNMTHFLSKIPNFL